MDAEHRRSGWRKRSAKATLACRSRSPRALPTSAGPSLSSPSRASAWRWNCVSRVRDEPTRIRIVIVDDHPMWREALEADLSQAGYDVVGTAGSLAQAVRVVPATRPDVLLLDLSLPDGNGVELVRRLPSLL